MKASFFIVGLLFMANVNAGEHALHAHEHGAIKLGMGVEKNTIELELDGPSESFIGFEYLPKTDKDKKTFNDAKDLWEKKLLTLITPDQKFGCKITEASFAQVIDQKETKEEQAKIKDPKKKEEGVHSDIEAKAKISCAKEIAGSEVQVSLKKYFKNIKKLNVEVISGEAKNVEITKAVQSFKI